METDTLREAEKVANEEPDDECAHEWRPYGTAEDGTRFYRCRKCKKQTEE